MYCFTSNWPNFQVVLRIIKAYVCFHILAKGHQVLTFFICSVYYVLFYNKMAKLSSSAMHNKGLSVLSQIGRRSSGVNFLCSVYEVLFNNKMAKLSSSAMLNKGLCVLPHIGTRTSGVNFLYLFSILCTVLQQNGQSFK